MTPLGTKSPVNLKALAQDLGISIGTVSRSLNNRYGVNAKTRARVLEAARRYGYVPNAAARRLKEHPVLNVGLFFAPFIADNREINPAGLRLVELFKETAASQGLAVHLEFYTDDARLSSQLEAHQTEVAAFYGQFPPSTFQAIHELEIPALVLFARTEYADQVSVLEDSQHAAATAVQYLAALGHEKLAVVTAPRVSMHSGGYLEGFERAMSEFGLPYRRDWVFELESHRANKDGAYEALIELLKSSDRPTGIVFASDWMALGGRKAARDAGLRVPEDLSIVGHDNLPNTADLDPPLTTFDLHLPELAQVLTRLAVKLSNLRRGPLAEKTRDVYLRSDLIKRQSCACVRRRCPN